MICVIAYFCMTKIFSLIDKNSFLNSKNIRLLFYAVYRGKNVKKHICTLKNTTVFISMISKLNISTLIL